MPVRLNCDALQATFHVGADAEDSYTIAVTSGNQDIHGPPTTVQILPHITQPQDWIIASGDIVQQSLTGISLADLI